MNASAALEVVAYYEGIFRLSVPDEVKPLWITKLSPLDQDETIATIDRIGSAGGYPPNVLQIVAETRRGVRPTAYEAWLSVLAEIRRVGIYGEPTEVDATTGRAIAIIGWHAICNSSDEDTRMLEQFRRVYDSLQYSEDRRNAALAAVEGMRELAP